MMFSAMLLAAAVSAQAPPPAAAHAPAAAPKELFRLELAGKQTLWAKDRPVQSGGSIVFHRYPDGVLLSVKSSDVTRIVVSRFQAPAAQALKPGAIVDVGATAGAGGASRAGGKALRGGPVATAPQPGERPDGTALLNPDRPYNPDWDSKLVPGLNLPNPASPNDYQEGRTFGYPPASATQASPGDVPRSENENGAPPPPPQPPREPE